MTTYSALLPRAGALRRLWFEAESVEEAREFAARVGAGLEGEAAPPNLTHAAPSPVCNVSTARALLGGISRSTLYRELAAGRLERVPHTGRVLVTRASIERRCRSGRK